MVLGAIVLPYNKNYCLDVVTWERHPYNYKNKEKKLGRTFVALPPFLASIS
jgi:hypothetical protein